MARRTAHATIAIAAFTAVSGGIGFAQWWVLSGTLDEMRAEQRPWVFSDIGEPFGPLYRKENTIYLNLVNIKEENSGGTPRACGFYDF
jgi:hypothetical protein